VIKSFEATRQSATGGVALLVGLGGRLAALCTGTAMDIGLRSMSVARSDDACERMATIAPRVVVVSGMLPRDEVIALTHAARAAGAEIVELPNIVTTEYVAHALARAMAMSEHDDEAPPTVPSHTRLRPA
jgi:hypothetical protein